MNIDKKCLLALLFFWIYLAGFVLAYVLALHLARRMWGKLQKSDFLLCLLVASLSWIFVVLTSYKDENFFKELYVAIRADTKIWWSLVITILGLVFMCLF